MVSRGEVSRQRNLTPRPAPKKSCLYLCRSRVPCAEGSRVSTVQYTVFATNTSSAIRIIRTCRKSSQARRIPRKAGHTAPKIWHIFLPFTVALAMTKDRRGGMDFGAFNFAHEQPRVRRAREE